jgi:hypothetical protein
MSVCTPLANKWVNQSCRILTEHNCTKITIWFFAEIVKLILKFI